MAPPAPVAVTAQAPLSQKARSRGGSGCALAILAVFAAAGLAFFGLIFASPTLEAVASRTWAAVPCTILASSVVTHPSSDGGDTYSVEVAYAYEYAGQAYRGDRYGFLGGSSSGRGGKEEVVARLPPGARVTCWVDPVSPASAVLDRSLFPWVLLGCFPLLFVAIGVGGMVAVAASARRGRGGVARRRRTATPGAVAPGPAGAAHELAGASGAPRGLAEAGLAAWAPHGAAVLEPGGSRLGRLVGLVLVAALWNGIVGLGAFAMWRDGELGLGCATLFLLPFAVVGLLLLLAVPHQLLALANPRPVLDLSGPLHPGAEVTIGWRFRGAASRLRRLVITIEGREEASYRQGTSTRTDRRVFLTLPVVETDDRWRVAQGSALVTLPPDTMHSFAASHNKVVWEIKVHGDIRLWPDVADSIPLAVYPREMT